MWQAKLDAIESVLTVSDSVGINVTFADAATGRSFTKSYKLSSAAFPDLVSVRDAVTADVAQLGKLDATASALQAYVGKRIDK